jgi:hypothetical protein
MLISIGGRGTRRSLFLQGNEPANRIRVPYSDRPGSIDEQGRSTTNGKLPPHLDVSLYVRRGLPGYYATL